MIDQQEAPDQEEEESEQDIQRISQLEIYKPDDCKMLVPNPLSMCSLSLTNIPKDPNAEVDSTGGTGNKDQEIEMPKSQK